MRVDTCQKRTIKEQKRPTKETYLHWHTLTTGAMESREHVLRVLERDTMPSTLFVVRDALSRTYMCWDMCWEGQVLGLLRTLHTARDA